ncbi:MAG: cytidine deaminase, partial [Pseudomonadota bacterium]|nr:cytidine deaminase [Pseudomonadota bacterium]
MSYRETMIERATAAMQFAYSPYSNFKVGACIRTDDDQYFTGCNIENISYGLTICAEACALSNLISTGDHHIAEVAITCSTIEICGPCG